MTTSDYERGFRAGVEAAAKWCEEHEEFQPEDSARIRALAPDAQPRGEPE